jgi:hypothetical protein
MTDAPITRNHIEHDVVCKLLPFDGRMVLVRASKTPGDGITRVIAIEQAENQVRRNFPTFFHPVTFQDDNHE